MPKKTRKTPLKWSGSRQAQAESDAAWNAFKRKHPSGKKTKRHRPETSSRKLSKSRNKALSFNLESWRVDAMLSGFLMRVEDCGPERARVPHVMLELDGNRVADFWPSSGKAIIRGERLRFSSFGELLSFLKSPVDEPADEDHVTAEFREIIGRF